MEACFLQHLNLSANNALVSKHIMILNHEWHWRNLVTSRIFAETNAHSTKAFHQHHRIFFTNEVLIHAMSDEATKVIYECLKDEIPLESARNNWQFCHSYKGLGVIWQASSWRPIKKIMPFKTTDEKYWLTLSKIHELPQTMESMRRYIADPRPHTKRLVSHIRFSTTKSLNQMKKNPSFMEWLKKAELWISINQITSTNIRHVSFLEKYAAITNLANFQSFVKHCLALNQKNVIEFQLNHDSIGDVKNATQSRAIVLICASNNMSSYIRDSCLMQLFPLFSPYPALYAVQGNEGS